MQNVRDKLTKGSLLGFSLAVLFFLAHAAYKENFGSDWYRYQSEYKQHLVAQAGDERELQAAERFGVGQKQLYLPDLSRIDRCITCHVSIDNPSMKDNAQPLMAHPGEIVQNHPKEQFGCTVCHAGQGRATTAADAHGHVGHWPEPMVASEELDRSCPKCHTEVFLPEAGRYNAAMDIVYEYGCFTCHKLRGRGGDIGPDLTNAGELHDAEWHFKHFKDPKSVVETSEMPNENLSDEQAQLLTFLVMCYSGEAIPTKLLSNVKQQGSQMKLPEPLDSLALEGFVGSEFCLSCHGATHPETVKAWRESAMTSTFERIRNEPVKDNCVPCHTTGLNAETGHYSEEGVGCEACHGPGREAVRRILAGEPQEHKRLIRIDQNSKPVCKRCHNPHIATLTHAEFYRKLPPSVSQPIIEEDPIAVIRPEPGPPTEAQLVAKEESNAAMEPEPVPPAEVLPTTVELAVKEEPSVAVESERVPPTEVQATPVEPIAKEESNVSTERNLVPPTEPQPIAMASFAEKEPAVAINPAPIASTGFSAAPSSETSTRPQFDKFSSASTARPPEKIEGGCITSECHSSTVFGEVVHGPTAQQDCEACHSLVDEPRHKFELTAKEPDLCFECHDPPETAKFLHGPVTLGVCTVCHNPHSGPSKFMLPKAGNMLCFMCHTDMQEHIETVSVGHGVIKEDGGRFAISRQSLADMKAAGLPKDVATKLEHLAGKVFATRTRLRNEVAELLSVREWADHEAFILKYSEKGCIVCHDPHRSDFDRQLKEDTLELCMGCHDSIREIVENVAVDHGALTEDKKCANCHSPHGSDMPKMLADQEADLCLNCHNEPMETENGPIINMKAWIENNPERHGPIREGSCTLCHQPHGSEHFRILTHEFPRKFYSPFSVEVYDLCFQCHEDTLVLDELTTALTDFRNGNKNLHYVHVNQKKGRTCRACHEIHAGTKPKRIKDFVPFGTWKYPIEFELLPVGGKCAPGCHLPRAYNREQAIEQK